MRLVYALLQRRLQQSTPQSGYSGPNNRTIRQEDTTITEANAMAKYRKGSLIGFFGLHQPSCDDFPPKRFRRVPPLRLPGPCNRLFQQGTSHQKSPSICLSAPKTSETTTGFALFSPCFLSVSSANSRKCSANARIGYTQPKGTTAAITEPPCLMHMSTQYRSYEDSCAAFSKNITLGTPAKPAQQKCAWCAHQK